MCVLGVHTCACLGQMATFWSWFSPLPLCGFWDFYLLSHLSGPWLTSLTSSVLINQLSLLPPSFPSLLFLSVRKRWMNRLSVSSAHMRVVPRALVETFFCCRDNILGQKQLTKGLCCLAAPGDSLSCQGSHDRSLKQLVSHPAPIIRSREP